MGQRSHKKNSGGSNKKKHKRKHAHQQHTAVDDSSSAEHVPGWRQQDYQQRAQQLAAAQQNASTASANADAECAMASAAAAAAPSSEARPRSGSRKKRQHTPAWMIDKNEVELSASPSAAAASSSGVAAASLSSACWNDLPRDCLLHVFSFFDLHAIARLTGTSRYWHAALCRGVLARVLEQSWRILRQRKQAIVSTPPPPTPSRQSTEEYAWADEDEEETATPDLAPVLVQPLPLHSLSHVISPLGPIVSLDEESTAAPIPPPAAPSPSLSSLPPAAALKAISTSTLALSSSSAPTAQSVCVAGAPFSSSSTLFRASMLHLRSLYFGQKQLSYSLASNPLFQNLSVMYHLSACHERMLHTLRHVHVALYRAAHAGKWPRSTKVDENAMLATHTRRPDDRTATDGLDMFDLMPLHFNLDAAVYHRTALLTQLQRSQKQIWEFLHATPVIVHFGFDGSSLAGIQLDRLRSRVEERLQAQLRSPRTDTQRGRYKSSGKGAAAAATIDGGADLSVCDPQTGEVVLVQAQDLPARLLPPTSPPLLTAADADHIDASLRRMAKLANIWAVYLHSSVTQHMHDEAAAAAVAAAQAEEDSGAMAALPYSRQSSDASVAASAAAAPIPSLKASASSIEREWDSCALLWRAQHARLQRLHAFWHSLGKWIRQSERATLMADIVAKPAGAAGASSVVQAASNGASNSASNSSIGASAAAVPESN